MAKHFGLKPGQTVPVSGIYEELGPRGGKITQVTSVKGEPLPPSVRKGSSYKLVTAAKHKKK